jgi:2-polyprenyl-3-methyl-5-hydroxy-6-metoxy-1,4-benzoquinol methylase
MLIVKMCKAMWKELVQERAARADKDGGFEKLYSANDPWQMESDREQFRFQETNRIIEREFGKVGTLLEIGCGEGYQTEHLSRLCDRLYGFDVSKTAVDRALRRCSEARLQVADMFGYRPEIKKFDLVVACEVLYYVQDVPAALARMRQLGSRYVVTYFLSAPYMLDGFLRDIDNLQSQVITFGDTSWMVVWWGDGSARRQPAVHD